MKGNLICVACSSVYKPDQIRYRCDCGEVLEYKNTDVGIGATKELFKKRLSDLNTPFKSGVWRYKELLIPLSNADIITKPEGNTNLYAVGTNQVNGFSKIGRYTGIESLYLKHEGENPTGSFKDRGMTTAITMAKKLRVKAVACASTGNTSASLASYAALSGIPCFVFIPYKKVARAKLSQTQGFGAHILQIEGDFDEAMGLVEEVCNEQGIYLVNSINPFRIEGQKTIAFELLQQLQWKKVDWIVLPAGNLGNTSAIGKALLELKQLGFIKKVPKVAAIQAKGANAFYQSYKIGFKKKIIIKANTIATAINMGNPVSFLRAKHVIEKTQGVVEEVSDEEILDAKAIIDACGIGCEPASAATVAGIKKLVAKKIIKPKDTVVGILTGHLLKDSETTSMYHSNMTVKEYRFANPVISVGKSGNAIEKAMQKTMEKRSTF